MTKHSKSLIFAVVITILLTVFTLTCFATTGDVPDSTESPVNPTSAPTDAPTTAPTSDSSTDPTTDPSDVPTTDPTEDPSTEPTETPTEDDNHYDDFNNYGDGDNDGIPDNTDNTVDDVENDTTQFPTSEMDRAETQWTEITLDKNNTTSSAKSFKAIKENTTTNKNFTIFLIIGICLLTLAAIGIIYFILAMVTYSKKKKQTKKPLKPDASRSRVSATHLPPVINTHNSSDEKTVSRSNTSEEFLTAADYYNKIRHSSSGSAPKHSASDKGKHYK